MRRTLVKEDYDGLATTTESDPWTRVAYCEGLCVIIYGLTILEPPESCLCCIHHPSTLRSSVVFEPSFLRYRPDCKLFIFLKKASYKCALQMLDCDRKGIPVLRL